MSSIYTLITLMLAVAIVAIVAILLIWNHKKKYKIEIRTVQDNIEEFYNKDGSRKHITFYLDKDKTVMDVKLKIMEHIKHLNNPKFNLRLAPMDYRLKDNCQIQWLEPKDNIIKLFIHIPGW